LADISKGGRDEVFPTAVLGRQLDRRGGAKPKLWRG